MITNKPETLPVNFKRPKDWLSQELLIREVLHEAELKPVYEDTSLAGFAHEDRVSVSLTDRAKFNPYSIRKDFPILETKIYGNDLIWFDNGATTQKPRQVIERIRYFYETENSNVHRGAHALAAQATDAYESAREKVQMFIGAKSPEEIVFTRGTTESINLVAETYGRAVLQAGDKVAVTELEHHANIVPWQKICREKGAELIAVPIDESGQVILSEFLKILGDGVKIFAATYVSNVLGIITPVREMTAMAHSVGAVVLVDGAQAAPHIQVDVADIGCDFFAFSGHKVYGPTGIGVLYGKKALLDMMPPYQTGGNMIENVTFQQSQFQKPPRRFEAGTGSIADAVGLGAALDYVNQIGIDVIADYENRLTAYAMRKIMELPTVEVLAAPRRMERDSIACDKGAERQPERAAVISFSVKGISDEQVGKLMDKRGIALRAGHHCAQPVLRRFGKKSAVRASFSFYNTFEEIDQWIDVLSGM